MIRFCLIILLFIVGCGEHTPTTENMILRCGNCKRIIYDGPAEVDKNGIAWPTGIIGHHEAWDINCISKYSPDRDKYEKEYWGYEAGRKDALEFHYEKTFDPKIHHPWYVEAYKKGYKEVIDVRRLSKEDENEP